MKKINYLIISLISIFLFNINAYAASGSLDVSSSNVYEGDSFTVTVNINSSAAWNVHVTSSGPVSGCSINQADATANAMDTNKSFSATCTATGTGTITIRLSGDVTSASDGNAVNISGSRNVNVLTKPIESSTNIENNNTSTNTNNNSTNTNNSSTNINRNDKTNKSKNNNIRELSVEGYELTKVDNNNYTLIVPNDVTSINVKATAEDSKAVVSGVGSYNLNVGENTIQVIVTAENNLKRTINIQITRKDGYYMEDLNSLLNSSDDINIIINYDTVISMQDLENIKNNKKVVKFNYYDDNKNLIYSWIIDGQKLEDIDNLLTTISNDCNNKKEILKLSNYADGLFVEFKNENKIFSGINIKLFVGNKYEDSDFVNVYTYLKDNDKLSILNDKIKVENGYIEFTPNSSSNYFITMSNIINQNESVDLNEATKENPKTIIYTILLTIVMLLVIAIVITIFIKIKKKIKKN